MKTIGIINGPSLDRLGMREPEIYGTQTLADLEQLIKDLAQELGVNVIFFQSNHEGALIDKIAEWTDQKIDGIIINPAAYTHTSIALRDAVSASDVPFIEVHISNIYSREPFRQQSMVSSECKAVISGLGFSGYVVALKELV